MFSSAGLGHHDDGWKDEREPASLLLFLTRCSFNHTTFSSWDAGEDYFVRVYACVFVVFYAVCRVYASLHKHASKVRSKKEKKGGAEEEKRPRLGERGRV